MKKFGLVLTVLLLFGFVLSGCGDGNKDENEKEKDKDKDKGKGFTLTITGFPPTESGKIYGASLMDPDDPSDPTKLKAAGMPKNTGVFEFYYPNPGSIFPSMDKPYITEGAYALLIALIKLEDIANFEGVPEPEKTFRYKNGTPPGTVTFSGTNKEISFNWADFEEMVDPRLVGDWSNQLPEDEERTFSIHPDGSFSATLTPLGPAGGQGTVVGVLIRDGNDYKMDNMKEMTEKAWGNAVKMYNGNYVQIVLSENDTVLTLNCEKSEPVRLFFGGTYYRR